MCYFLKNCNIGGKSVWSSANSAPLLCDFTFFHLLIKFAFWEMVMVQFSIKRQKWSTADLNKILGGFTCENAEDVKACNYEWTYIIALQMWQNIPSDEVQSGDGITSDEKCLLEGLLFALDNSLKGSWLLIMMNTTSHSLFTF